MHSSQLRGRHCVALSVYYIAPPTHTHTHTLTLPIPTHTHTPHPLTHSQTLSDGDDVADGTDDDGDIGEDMFADEDLDLQAE